MSTPVIETSTSKNFHNQWVVKSTILLDEDKHLELKVYTAKGSSGNLTTYASVDTVSEDGNSTMHMPFIDYSKRLLFTKHKRVTLKIVEEQHAMIDWDSIIAEAKAHYNLV